MPPFAAYRHRLTRPSKYGAKQTEVDGIKFASLREAARYRVLKARKEDGAVLLFLRQTPFHFPGGGVYRCDFMVFWADGRVTVEDAKGMRTESYKFKRRLLEATYGIEITEV
jgi:hypothetical protein